MSVSRKLRRLATMGPREIGWRLAHAARIASERSIFRRNGFLWSDSQWTRKLCRHINAPPSEQQLAPLWLDHLQHREEPPFLLDRATLAGAADLYRRLFADRLPTLVEQAERTCLGQFQFLGIQFRAADPIDWSCDPVSGKTWPREFYADINVPFCDGEGSRGAPGDSKHVWELNRHEFLMDLGRAYYLTREPRYAARFFQIVAHWSQDNPYLQGVNWAGPLEVALRAMAWLWTYQFCRSWAGIDPLQHLVWVKACYLHGAYLYRHLEIYSSPNNHLVGEATALYLLGSFFPEFDEAPAWREHAWRILQAEPARQFYEDGGSTEQAFSYHHYCLGFFLLTVLTRRCQGLPIPLAMLTRLEAACGFSMWITQPDGETPRVGDTDDARSIRLGPYQHWDFRNLLALAAAMFHRPDFKAMARQASEDLLWLMGTEGMTAFERLEPREPTAQVQCFSHSGYAVFRSGWDREAHFSCFDGGELGVGLRDNDVAIFTHGHADMLSLNVSAFGRPVLVDSGFYTYNGCPAWHRYTRDVQGHNTLRIRGVAQAKFQPKNAWSCVSRPLPLEYRSTDTCEVVTGTHGGFFGVPNCTGHRRTVVWNRAACWAVFDRLTGSGMHEIEWYWHFAPGTLEVDASGQTLLYRSEQGVHVTFAPCGDLHPEWEIVSGGPQPHGGWVATSYGVAVPAPVAVGRLRAALPTTVGFVLTGNLGACQPPSVEYQSAPEMSLGSDLSDVKLVVRDAQGQILLSLDGQPPTISSAEDNSGGERDFDERSAPPSLARSAGD